MENLAEIGLVGLAVMGQNLALNINDHGFRVAVFNRTTSKVTRFLDNEAKGTEYHRRLHAGRICPEHQTSSQADPDDSSGRGGGQVNRSAGAAAG